MDCEAQIYSDEYADLILDFGVDKEVLLENDPTLCIYEIDEDIHIVHKRREEGEVFSRSEFRYLFLPNAYGIMENAVGDTERAGTGSYLTVMEQAGIAPAWRPPLSLTGLGTCVAIIDTGIDYNNPAFIRDDGTSRILAIWDQTDETGTPPEGFWYGSFYTRENINEALASRNPLNIVPVRDITGRHGTAVASIAAGRIKSENGGDSYRGAAYEADIIVVKLKQIKDYLRQYYSIPSDVPCYGENDILTALKFVSSFLVPLQRPVSVCLGIGSSFGPHEGKSILSRYIQKLSYKRNLCISVTGGNEGNEEHHFRDAFREGEGESRTVEIRVGEGVDGFFMQFWGTLPNRFTLSVRSPGGERVSGINSSLERTTEFSFIYDDTRLTVDVLPVEPLSGQELVVFRFVAPTPGIWQINVVPNLVYYPAFYDFWLPITAFMSGEVTFTEPNPYITLTAPSMAQDCICVAPYVGDTGGLYPAAGRGYTRIGTVKPDIAAPGVNIPTPVGVRSGGSMAAAIVCGAAALYQEWAVVQERDPLINGVGLRKRLIRGAERLLGGIYPNRENGYGFLDLEGVFRNLAER